MLLRTSIWLGPGRSVIFYPLRAGELFNFVGWVPAEEVHRESWTTSGDVEELRRTFAGACNELRATVDAIDEAFITAIYFRDPLESWGTARTVLLGDAAHPAPPFAGQGAGMALEDAVVLGGCLRRHGATGLPAALVEYAQRRRPRTMRMLTVARANQRFMHEADPAIVRDRNGRFRGMKQLDPLGETPWGWLYGYDPVAALEQPLEALAAAAAEVPNTLERPEARRAFELWRGALGPEDHAGGWVGQRAGYERFLLGVAPPPRDVAVAEKVLDGVPVLRVGDGDGPVVLHLHGGGYVMARASVELAARLAAAVGGSAVVPDYRLAPDHAYPAALEVGRGKIVNIASVAAFLGSPPELLDAIG